jgi:CheY-like chemotaxis protein
MAHELIVLIEDNERNRKLARDVLTHQGYRVVEAESAEDGLALVARERPALILMDIHLPGIDGIEALRRLRADAGTRDIPVLASPPRR